MLKHRKIRVVLAVVLGILAAVTVVAFRDGPPPEDADLMAARTVVRAEENGYLRLAEVFKLVDFPKYEERSVLSALAGKSWDGPLANELLRKNKAALAGFREAMGRPGFQVPERSGRFDRPRGFAETPRAIALLGLLEATRSAKEGRGAAAVEQVFEVLGWGQRMEKTEGSFFDFENGSEVKGIALDWVRRWAPHGSLPSDRLKNVASQLGGFRVQEAALASALRGFYRDFTAGVSEYSQKRGLKDRYLFHPNQTRAAGAENFRAAMADTGRSYSDMRFPADLPRGHVFLAEFHEEFAPNCHGNGLRWGFVNLLGRALILKCAENSRVEATRAALAVAAFRTDHGGEWPKDLEALVPAYLDRVPVDDFDGKPLRYDPSKKRVWSVGQDLKDAGGEGKEGDDDEIRFDLE